MLTGIMKKLFKSTCTVIFEKLLVLFIVAIIITIRVLILIFYFLYFILKDMYYDIMKTLNNK